MRRLIIPVLPVLVAILALTPPALRDARIRAQTRMVSLVAQDRGHAALGLAIRRLNVAGTFMQTAAHPDDEHNALYALFTLGQGLRSVDVQTTRGAGGQNEIGPELFQDLAVLRTSELLAAHRLDGAEQWFTRAIDYGYSFSPPEIYEKWGKQAVMGDFVRLIRTFRPDVILTMNIQGRGGDRAHEATAVLTRAAFRAAADPAQFPEQIEEGLRPWQASKLYFTSGFGGGPPAAGAPPARAGAPPPGGGRPPGAPPAPAPPQAPIKVATVDTAIYDELLGRTYAEIGAEAHSNHKCQGMGQLLPLAGVAGGRGGRYQVADTAIPLQMDKDETSLFAGVDTRLTGLARFAGPNPPEVLTTGLAAIAEQARRAQAVFEAGKDEETGAPIVAGLAALRGLRAQLGSLALSDTSRYEIDFRLKTKERDYEDAVLAAHGVSIEALADDGLVVGGQPVKLTVLVANRGTSEVAIGDVAVTGFDGRGTCTPGTATKKAVYTCGTDVHVPRGARLTAPYWTDEYWQTKPPKAALDVYEPDVPFGAPFRPTPFHATVRLMVGGAEITRDLPIQYRYEKDIFIGEKRMELNVVPAFSVETMPTLAVIPVSAGAAVEREIHVSVTSGIKGASAATVTLDLPDGWKAVPPNAPLAFTNEDESLTVRFRITVPPDVKPGDYRLQAVVTSPVTGTERFTSGYHEVDYPHIERRQVTKPAETKLKVMDVKVVPNVRIGYVVGAGDQVPPALEQLGAKVAFLGPDDLAWGDLSAYDVIVTGVRAYERRPDLRAYNRRLLDYASRGGTVIVQYNKTEFNQAQYGPYPAVVGRGRVTDENAPVKVLAPDHPVFTFPNAIGEAAWSGWVQERGLYFLGEKDPKYVDLVSMEDPFPDNPGVKLGALVEARVGTGRWLYVGLGLWRQIPAQVEGAYQLLANLISLPKAP